MKSIFTTIRKHAITLRKDITVITLIYRHPGTPWHVKVFTALIAAYALSPVDLIPDFIPLLGYLDDIILIPAGIYFILRMVPESIVIECREKADRGVRTNFPGKWIMSGIIIFIWSLLIGRFGYSVYGALCN